jgi:hypothetical protein
MTLSQQQKEERNVACIEKWAKSWSKPGGSAATMVDECYADVVEVLAVLQGKSVVQGSEGKDRWRAVEIDIERQYERRTLTFSNIVAQGDAVAVEGAVEMVAKDGSQRGWPFAVFFKFDSEGRIMSDHTYMPDSPHTDALTATV